MWRGATRRDAAHAMRRDGTLRDVGELLFAGATFFRGWISEHKDFLYNTGGTWPGPGELFSRTN